MILVERCENIQAEGQHSAISVCSLVIENKEHLKIKAQNIQIGNCTCFIWVWNMHLTLGKEHWLRISENRVPRKVCGPKGE